MPEGRDRRSAHRHGVVGEPPPQDLGKPLALPLEPVVAHRLQASFDLAKLGAHALSDRLPPEYEAAAIPAGRAVMREPEEGERLRPGEASPASVGNSPPTEPAEPPPVRG